MAPALAGAAVVAALVLLPAGTAGAAASSSVAINGPASGTVYKGGGPTVTGSGALSQPALQTNTITDLSLSVSGPQTAAGSSCDDTSCGATTGGGSTSFSFAPAVAYNGPYSVAVTMSGACHTLLGLPCSAPPSASASTSFVMAVPPAPPAGVKTTVNSDDTVTVSWNASPEPDLIGYQIQREGPGSPSWTVVNRFTAATVWTDTNTTGSGFYSYEVFAIRPGASGGTSDALSAASSPTGVVVTLPVAPTVPGETTTVAPSTTTTVAQASPGGLNISAFLNGAKAAGALPPTPAPAAPKVTAPQVVIPATPTTVAVPNTFAPTLPYGLPSSTVTTHAQGGNQVALPATSKSTSGSPRPVAIYVAGGLLLCLLGLGLRTANRRSRPEPLEPVHDDHPTGPVLMGGPGTGVAGARAATGDVELVGAGLVGAGLVGAGVAPGAATASMAADAYAGPAISASSARVPERHRSGSGPSNRGPSDRGPSGGGPSGGGPSGGGPSGGGAHDSGRSDIGASNRGPQDGGANDGGPSGGGAHDSGRSDIGASNR
ncbi:MAG: hypothetical protein ACRDZ8_18550, partial [Acidimicrobiales bacterium]